MPEWIVVSRSQHADRNYVPRHGFAHASHQLVSPVLITELPKLINGYVIGFIATGESFQPVALLGLEKDKNLYLNQDNKWLSEYVPASVRGYPFTMAKNEQGERVLCIDSAHLVKRGEGGGLTMDRHS